MNSLVTGAAGFIGAQVSKKLCPLGHHAAGIDNLNDYYDVTLKYARFTHIEHHAFQCGCIAISDHISTTKTGPSNQARHQVAVLPIPSTA